MQISLERAARKDRLAHLGGIRWAPSVGAGIFKAHEHATWHLVLRVITDQDAYRILFLRNLSLQDQESERSPCRDTVRMSSCSVGP